MGKLALMAAVAAMVGLTADTVLARGCSGGCCGGGCYAPVYAPVCGPLGCRVVPAAPAAPAKAEAAAPIKLVVTLPEDARLFIDDRPTTSTSGTRVFESPAVPMGIEYTYVLKAEMVVDGKTEVIQREVKVLAGEETKVNLQLPVAAAAK